MFTRLSLAKRVMVACTATLSFTAISVGSSPSAHADARFICNHGTSNLGVIHFLDNDYTYANYDVLLYPGKCTDAFPILWSTAAAFYVGPGYSAEAFPEVRPSDRVTRPSGTWGINEPVGVIARRN